MAITETYQNDLLLKAARGEKTERTPVWVMRQAGRILPEYRKVRQGLSGFKELVETPELAAEVTIQPVDILGVDAAIIFSDILVVPEAMGLPYVMDEGKGPRFPRVIASEDDIKSLRIANGSDDLHYVSEAIGIVKKQLDGRVPVIGFAGAPFTIFCYMIEGKGSKTFSEARKWLYQRPDLSHHLMDKIAQSTINYLKAQVKAGADILQLFDSWAGVLNRDLYRHFAIPYLQKIVAAVPEVPVTVFSKGAFFALGDIAQTGCRTVGIDWNTEAGMARRAIGNDLTLQGNLDPCVLYAEDKAIVEKTKDMLTQFAGLPHIANLGHGVYPDTEWQKVKLFIDTVKSHKPYLL